MKLSSLNVEKLKRFIVEEYSEEDKKYLDELFCDNGKEEISEALLKKQWYELLKEDGKPDKDLQNILYKIRYDISIGSGMADRSFNFGNIFRWVSRIAAIIILPFAIYSGIYFYGISDKEDISFVEIKAPAWTKAQCTLPDGSHMWLNSNSSITYKEDFTKNREVFLNGEAFFDVYKESNKPFKVIVNNLAVTALGTKFNIASYENENDIEIVLEEGKIECYDQKLNITYSMNPRDYLSYDKTRQSTKREVVQPEKYSSWKEGKLVFRNDRFDVVVRRLERWYNIEVDNNVALASDLRLYATFIDEDLQEVLFFLKRCFPIDYHIENGDLNQENTYTKKKVIISPIE